MESPKEKKTVLSGEGRPLFDKKEFLKYLDLSLHDFPLNEVEILEIASQIFEEHISTHYEKPQSRRLGIVRIRNSDGNSSESSKISNLFLDMERLLFSISNGAFSAVAVVQIPWMLPFALLVMIQSIRNLSKVKITRVEAIVICAMWKVKNNDLVVSLDAVMNRVSLDVLKHQMSAPTELETLQAIDNLIEIGSIRRCPNEHGKWILVEKVKMMNS